MSYEADLKKYERRIKELERLLEIERQRVTHQSEYETAYSNAYNEYIVDRMKEYGYNGSPEQEKDYKYAQSAVRFVVRLRKAGSAPRKGYQYLPRIMEEYKESVEMIDQILPSKEG